jgi:hypothetical protein
VNLRGGVIGATQNSAKTDRVKNPGGIKVGYIDINETVDDFSGFLWVSSCSNSELTQWRMVTEDDVLTNFWK